MGKSSKGMVVQPKALIGKLAEVNLKFQLSVTVTVRCDPKCAVL